LSALPAPRRVGTKGGRGMSSVDERYTRLAKLEVLGPDYADNPNLILPQHTLVRILDRANQLKAEEVTKPLVQSWEIAADLRQLGQQNLGVVLRYIADRVYYARLRDGSRVCDVIDFKQLLEEIAEAIR
jgi:hypothetical protein